MASDSNQPKRVLILGSDFGGLYTALHLEKKLGREAAVEITLVNRENFFLFTPMLHEVAAGDLDLTHIVNPTEILVETAGLSSIRITVPASLVRTPARSHRL
ncbi:MAG TPA: hypothetical protein VJV03_02355 [Pyrinomonadaceae bacterium]|nr:hypothetical protein [Pyrinomonadaceae bacterium]